ncbi:MAG: hypothetical protein JSU63_14290 [Phycisphaerales bacterium]|nr:MAG: hypothetical protein JSU63_14290 [Phycisphaerales bacterium]
MSSSRVWIIGLGLLSILAACGSASADTVPWELFVDDPDVSDSQCDVINAGTVTLLAILPSRELEIIGEGVIDGSYVDTNGDVSFDDLSVGFLSFAEDGDGYRTLWWLSETDGELRIVDVIGSPPEPVVTTYVPSEFINVPCGACELEAMEDSIYCVEPECLEDIDCYDGNECTDDVCDSDGECRYFDNTDSCNDGDACTQFDFCLDGVCAGEEIEDCVDNPIGPITISFCGNGATLAMTLTFMGLLSMGLIRRW